MKANAPPVALRRREAALNAFRKKLDILEKLLAQGDLSRFPDRTSISAFASWENAELEVTALSRSAMYSNDAEYPELRRHMEHLITRVKQLRAKGTRKQQVAESLRQRLAIAEDRARSYANQYSVVRAELLAVRAENARLQEKLKRLSSAKNANVVSLHAIRSPQRDTHLKKDE